MKIISGLFKGAPGVFSKLFGSFSWSPPPWFDFLKNFFSNIRSLASRFTTAARSLIKKPRISDTEIKPAVEKRSGINFMRLAKVLAVIFVIFALLMWYAAHRRGMIRVSGTTPELTKIEDTLKPDPVRVQFSGSAARLDLIGKSLTQGISIAPAIEGDWTWSSDKALVFRPKTDWLPGTEYTVRMDKSLFPDHVKLSSHSYSFQTPRFAAELTNTEFYQDPEDPKIKKVIATIKFTHPVDPSISRSGSNWSGPTRKREYSA